MILIAGRGLTAGAHGLPQEIFLISKGFASLNLNLPQVMYTGNVQSRGQLRVTGWSRPVQPSLILRVKKTRLSHVSAVCQGQSLSRMYSGHGAPDSELTGPGGIAIESCSDTSHVATTKSPLTSGEK